MDKNIINLEQNGRILPLWIMKNFKDFIIPRNYRKRRYRYHVKLKKLKKQQMKQNQIYIKNL
jgi:hypothetical protein